MLKSKKFILIIMFFTIIYMILCNKCLAVTGKVTGKTVRIREAAKEDAEIITNAYKDDTVEVIEKNGEWYKVTYEGKTGYMHGDYLSVNDSELSATNTSNTNTSNTTTLTTNTVNETTENNVVDDNNTATSNTVDDSTTNNSNVSVYENNSIENVEGKAITLKSDTSIKLIPNLKSKVLGQITSGTEITVKNQLNYWAYVTSGSVSGWINIREVIDTSEVAHTSTPEEKEPDEEENKPTTTESQTGKVNVSKANVREKASTSSDIIAGLSMDDEVTILEETGDWYKIKTSSIAEGYVSKRLITITDLTSRGNIDRELDNLQRADIEENTEEKQEEQIKTISSSESVPVESKAGEEVAEFALQYMGYDYVSGGKNPDTGFDCSGFTQYVFSEFGVNISASSSSQINYGEEVSLEEIAVGDLLVFLDDSKSKVGHVGIYIGNDEFVHAANAKRGVVTDSIYSSYYNPRLVSIRRLV